MDELMTVPRRLLELLVKDEPCSFDHHGNCQSHYYFGFDPGEICPQQRLKVLLYGDEVA